jgi:hypothetical protein
LYDGVTGKPEKVTLVDLQMVREGCPTLDLVIFLLSSTALSRKCQYELLEIYHDEFLKHCNALKVEVLPGFNLETLRRRYRRSSIFGFVLGIGYLQIILKPKAEAVDLDAMGKEVNMNDLMESALGKVKENSKLKKRLVELVEELYADGVI